MRLCLRRIWCAIRHHPYRKRCEPAPEGFYCGDDPLPPSLVCSHCRKVFR